MTNHSSKSENSKRPSDDSLGSRRVTGKDLTELEELDIKLDTLVSLLSEKGIVSKREYANNVMMRLHETSKAKSFEDLDEEI
ncbi:MAG TPA: hypothetical protein VFR94_05360 [Nitrososphaeraceae archaeon]|nr:hypothetical protein [Nitrososphaeraceae archaeon]